MEYTEMDAQTEIQKTPKQNIFNHLLVGGHSHGNDYVTRNSIHCSVSTDLVHFSYHISMG